MFIVLSTYIYLLPCGICSFMEDSVDHPTIFDVLVPHTLQTPVILTVPGLFGLLDCGIRLFTEHSVSRLHLKQYIFIVGSWRI